MQHSITFTLNEYYKKTEQQEKASKEDFQCAAKGVIPLNMKSSNEWALCNRYNWRLLHSPSSCADCRVPTRLKDFDLMEQQLWQHIESLLRSSEGQIAVVGSVDVWQVSSM